MNYNSLIEIGSKANVILRFKSATTINDISYAANEPYLFLKDVNVLIEYSNQDKVGQTDVNVIANSNIKPRTIIVGGFPLTKKIVSLLACYREPNEESDPEVKSVFKTLIATREEGDSEGIILIPDEDFVDNENLFVYDDNFETVEFTYNAAQNALISSAFTNESEYLVSFSTEIVGSKFDLNKPHIPYMSLEVQGVGNINKVKKEIIMYFDKVSLNSLIEFTFIQDEIVNVPLQFHIIEDKNNYVVFED
jgi:hypothetical protein